MWAMGEKRREGRTGPRGHGQYSNDMIPIVFKFLSTFFLQDTILNMTS